MKQLWQGYARGALGVIIACIGILAGASTALANVIHDQLSRAPFSSPTLENQRIARTLAAFFSVPRAYADVPQSGGGSDGGGAGGCGGCCGVGCFGQCSGTGPGDPGSSGGGGCGCGCGGGCGCSGGGF